MTPGRTVTPSVHDRAVRSVIYCRISDDVTGRGLGVARQERESRALVERNGWMVADVLVDNDRSAYSGRRRPSYEALVDGLKVGTWDVVVAWHPDRLHRSPKELEAFIDLLDATGAKVETVMAGYWDLSTPSGRLVARQLGAVARYESEHKSERMKAKHRELFLAGQPSGGDRCFGYGRSGADRLTVVEHEAVVLREVAEAILAGRSLRSLCTDLNRRGIPTAGTGTGWAPVPLKRLVTSAHVAGKRERDGVVVDAAWPAVLPWETVQRLRVLLNDPARRMNLRSRAYLLTGGIAVCGICRSRLHARPRPGGRRAYVCASGVGFDGCGGVRVLAEPFEADAEARLTARLRRLRLPRPSTDVTPLLAALEADQAALAQASVDFYAERKITPAQFTAASEALGRRIAATEAAIARAEDDRLVGDLAQPAVAAELYREATLEGKRAIWRTWVDAVVLGPAVRGRNFYDDDRTTIEWRVRR